MDSSTDPKLIDLFYLLEWPVQMQVDTDLMQYLCTGMENSKNQLLTVLELIGQRQTFIEKKNALDVLGPVKR